MLFEIFVIFILILLNGVFSMSEIALVSSRKFKLQSKAENGNNGAKKALDLAENPGKFFSTVQVGITLIGILTGVFGGATISEYLDNYLKTFPLIVNYSSPLATIIVVVSITYFTLILGELFPKRIGMSFPETVSSFVSIPMTILSLIAKPVIWILDSSTEILIKIFRLNVQSENFVTEEEIRSMLEQAPEVEKEEKEMLERVFFLGDTNVGSLMTSKNEITMLNIDDEIETIIKNILSSLHSNYPVYEGTEDNIIGVLSLKNFSTAMMLNKLEDFRLILKEPFFITENIKAFKLLERMKEIKENFAIAVNEYGSPTGVVTSNDLFKVIVGDMHTRQDALEIIQRSDGSFMVDGLISLDEFFMYFKIDEVEELKNKGFYTLGGLILYLTDHIPKAGEVHNWKNFTFEILDMDGNRVDKILVFKQDS